ncbi:putative transcription factor [Triangularia verruculosa]|uniref:Transcription factor n=1 Tax=Triangularia verruculosa TaxID=2587418 RepID=A0AAN6XQT0_9PEZI|nr:putative transcription factor [Triangularia verruculosa]
MTANLNLHSLYIAQQHHNYHEDHHYHPEAHSLTPPAYPEANRPSPPRTSSSSHGDSPPQPKRVRSLNPLKTTIVDPQGKKPTKRLVQTSKARRVRTGCFTCRDRHVKCDEGAPVCNNCLKSNRQCKRGVRLNFAETNQQVKGPPRTAPRGKDWLVSFQDDSREIASGYKGGLESYTNAPNDDLSASPIDDFSPITPSRKPFTDVQSHGAPPLRNPNTFEPSKALGSLPEVSRAPYYPIRSEPPLHQEQVQAHFGGGEAHLPSQLPLRNPEPYHPNPLQPPQPHHHPFTLEDLLQQHRPIYPIHRRRDSDVSRVTSSLIPEGSNNARNPDNDGGDGLMTPFSENGDESPTSERDYLSTEHEINCMQVFINDVAVWMDVFDKDKHFSTLVPSLAFKSTMLLNAVLACGVKQHSLMCPPTSQAAESEKARVYYDTSTSLLLRSLQNPDRNTDECCITAVVLNVYDIMNETESSRLPDERSTTQQRQQRLEHIRGARALIRENDYNAGSTSSLARACFWLNVGLEVLSCLSFNWTTSWEPDDWGMDLEFTTWIVGSSSGNGSVIASSEPDRDDLPSFSGPNVSSAASGDEELWAQRIIYILAKVTNFRASSSPTIPVLHPSQFHNPGHHQHHEPSPHDEQVRLQSRFAEWTRLKSLLDAWNHRCPRSMRPSGYVTGPSSRSSFPNVWLMSRPAIIGRLFYHVCMVLLAQTNPLHKGDTEENRSLQKHHGRQVCGIVSTSAVGDKGVSSVAIRGLAVAGAVLDSPQEREEVLSILGKIGKSTGWRLGGVVLELKKAWEVKDLEPMPPSMITLPGLPAVTMGVGMQVGRIGDSFIRGNAMAGGPPKMSNPLLKGADFRDKEHPYQSWHEDGEGGVPGMMDVVVEVSAFVNVFFCQVTRVKSKRYIAYLRCLCLMPF